LALFALAVQLVLSFGHVHIYGVTPASANSAPSALADGSGSALPGINDPFHKSNGSADIDCPICALIQLTATAAPSVAPTLPLPPKLSLFRLQALAQLALAASPHFSFRARAPPTV
jgi:hypothetical protein